MTHASRLWARLIPFGVSSLVLVILFQIFSSLVAHAADTVGPGDVLKVDVFGEPDLTGTFPVRENGTVKINWVEPIAVGGMSVDEAQDAIRKFLDLKYIIDPKVSVTISEYVSRTVSVMGEVAKPGMYRLRDDSTLLSILLEAGGPSPKAGGDLTILRGKEGSKGDYDTEDASIQKLLGHADPASNKQLRPGDIVYVPAAGEGKGAGDQNVVYVLGAVKNSGSFKYRKGYTVLDAVIDAGNVTKFASANGTKIFRGRGEKRQVIGVKLGDILKRGDRTKNMELSPGDLVIVPEGIL